MKTISLSIFALFLLHFNSCVFDPPCKEVTYWVCDKQDGVTSDVVRVEVVTYKGDTPDANMYQNCTIDDAYQSQLKSNSTSGNISTLKSCIQPGERRTLN